MNASINQTTSQQPLDINDVTAGPCASDCDVIYLFSGLFLLVCLTTFMTGTAAQTATIRLADIPTNDLDYLTCSRVSGLMTS